MLHHLTYTLLHSVWQGALLALVAFVANKMYISALAKKHIFLVSLVMQLVCSLFTFLFYNTNSVTSTVAYFNLLQVVTPYLMLVYSIVVVFKVLQLIIDWLALKNSVGVTIKASVHARLFTTLKCKQLAIKQKVHIYYSNYIHTPITIGFLKSLILIPVSVATQLSTSQFEALILHELAHIKYKDYLFNWLIIFVETIYFFNPAILAQIKQYKFYRELAADSLVLNFGFTPLDYSETLLKTATLQVNETAVKFGLGFLLQKSQLLQRIQFLNANPIANINYKPAFTTVGLGLVSLLILFLSYWHGPIKNASVAGMVSTNKPATILPIPKFNNNSSTNKTVAKTEATSFVSNKKQKLNTVSGLSNKPNTATKNATQQTLLVATEQTVTDVADILQPSYLNATYAQAAEPTINKKPIFLVVEEKANGSAQKKKSVFELVWINGAYKLQPVYGTIEGKEPVKITRNKQTVY
jgi:beta-lactamase regulating signal transducer with metallopeptidase domain